MPNYSIRPIPICKFPADKGLMTYRLNYGQRIDVHCYIWYIETPEAKVIVDTGTTAETCNHHGFIGAQDIQSPEEGLRPLKLKPGDIDLVILTHLHWDHAANASKFTKARFVIQKTELDFAKNPHPVVASAYDLNSFKDLDFEVVDGDKEILKGVKVLFTPGHTPGVQSVAIETSKGQAIITGFCCTSANFEPPIELKARGIQIITPGIHTNTLQAYDSVIRVKQIADIILPSHDAGFLVKDRIP